MTKHISSVVKLVFIHIMLFFLPNSVFSQATQRHERPISPPLILSSVRDSLLRLNEDSLIAKTLSPVDTMIHSKKSSTLATLASMVIPGAGQIYNGSYWKAPIVWGMGVYFGSIYLDEKKLYEKHRDLYEASVLADSVHKIGNLNEKELRDFYRSQRDNFAWYLAIAYLVNVLDAYVDAVLFNFEVSPNLQPRSEMRATLRIPIH